MEQSKTSIDNSVITPKYNSIRELRVQLERCDDMINLIIKKKVIDETKHNNDNHLLQLGTKEKNSIGAEVKIEGDLIKNCEFKGTVPNISYTSEIVTHMNSGKKSNLKENTLTCKVCSKIFSNSYKCQVHMRFHTSDSLRKRSIESFKGKADMRRRSTIRLGEKPYKCVKCPITYKRYIGLKYHLKNIHDSATPHSCDVCNERFVTRSKLNSHMFSHSANKPYKCSICDEEHYSLTNLKLHKMQHIGKKPYECKICSFKCMTSARLNIHNKAHTKVKPYKCDRCHQSFVSSSLFSWHKNTHTIIPRMRKRFICSICDEEFGWRKGLKLHTRDHRELKPYKCKICDYRCVSPKVLKMHNRFHAGKGSHKCDVCNIAFASNSTLTLHKKQHFHTLSEFGIFKCTICLMSFSRTKDLKWHLKLHTGTNSYKCGFCKETFRLARSIKIVEVEP